MTPPSQKTTRQSDTGGGSPLHITKFPSGVNLGSTAGGVEVAVPPAIGVVVDSGSVGWGGEAVGVAPEQETARRARAAEMRLTRITVPREGGSGILAPSLVGAPARPASPLGASATPRPAPTQPSPSQAPPPLAAPAAAPSRPRLRARPGSTPPMRRAQATPRLVPPDPPPGR